MWPHRVPRWFSAPWPFVIPFLAGVICVQVGWGCIRWGASRYLRLTPDGIELGMGLRSRSCEWGQIRSVTDNAPRARRRTPSWVVVVISDEKALSLAAGMLIPDVQALRDLVRFYWQNPEARGELIGGGAELRLEQYVDQRARPGEHV